MQIIMTSLSHVGDLPALKPYRRAWNAQIYHSSTSSLPGPCNVTLVSSFWRRLETGATLLYVWDLGDFRLL